jgi:Ca2+-binding RTX toxin-like protein
MLIKGSSSDDDLSGTDEADRIFGFDGDDRLEGRKGNDQLRGDGGDDVLYGEDGDDDLGGGDGDDTLRGGAGDDTLIGGAGADWFVFTSIDDGFDTIDGFSLDEGDELLFRGSLSGAPTKLVADGAGTVVWVSGDGGATFQEVAVLQDFLVPSSTTPGVIEQGTAGVDSLDGTDGNDTISGLDGADMIDGRAGDDVLNGGSGRYSTDPNDGADTILGGGGFDRIDGANGDDLLYGGAGNDYIAGGLGGNDQLSGEFGNDRLMGGFRGPQDDPGDAVDQDVLIGGPGRDAFESRVWIKAGGWVGMGTDTLGGNADLIADFVRGVDKIDVTVYRQSSGTFEFHQGGFEAFDTDGNGVLDGADDFATIGPVTFHGETATSITLDVGAANLAAGRLSPPELEDGPHTLTVFGQSGLEAGDFVPTNTYMGNFSRSATITGSSENDYIGAADANSTIDGSAGDDLLDGGPGRDTFTHRYTSDSEPGADLIVDFLRGEDLLDGLLDEVGGASGHLNFAALDDNANRVLDDGDAAVRITEAEAYQPGRGMVSEVSTVIDLDVGYGLASDWVGVNTVTLIGVSGLTGDDFADPGVGVV